jgi:uncharacterized membrane protein HdeD (DUF308 family)
MVRGMFNLVHAMLWKYEPFAERVLYGVMGLIGLIVGTVVALQPTAGGLAFVWVLGLYAVATGSALIALGLGIGKITRRTHSHAG